MPTPVIQLACCGLLTAMMSMSYAQETIRVKASARSDLSGRDDLARLQYLAAGVGWESEPNPSTTDGLRRLGMRWIRCINVDPLEGAFADDGSFVLASSGRFLDRLGTHLATCRAIGAQPHIILGTSLPPELRVPIEVGASGPGIMGQNGHRRVFGPTDPERYIAYLARYISYVMVDQGFVGARFEYGNEPDIHGQFPHPSPPLPGMGSRALFEGYLSAYRLAAAAADRVQQAHPDLAVQIGPSLAWAYTYRFGDFNWSTRIIEVCAAQRVRCDFLGLHFYGNIASIDGSYPSTGGYPTFTAMLNAVVSTRDRYLPGLPLLITEWGPSYHGAGNPSAMSNNDCLGAAWSLAFLDTLLQSPVEGALYLLTTDYRKIRQDSPAENVWGWPSLFTNPSATGGAWPKASYHAFAMLARLSGHRVEATRLGGGVGVFAAADPATRTVRILAWNSDPNLPESGPAIERAGRRLLPVEIVDAGPFFSGPEVAYATWLLSSERGCAFAASRRGETLDVVSTALPQVAAGRAMLSEGQVGMLLDLPPSSIALLEISAAPRP